MIPDFPDGATIGSIHAACVQLGRFKSVAGSLLGVYGIRTTVDNRFGLLADNFARNALDGTLTGDELIDRHTALPIVASLLPEESWHRWKKAQLGGDTTAWARYVPATVHGDVYAAESRFCPACVEEDIRRYGMPYWRVQHQLPSVSICKTHGLVLRDRCASCNAPYSVGTQMSLPGMPCRACGSTTASPVEAAKESPGAMAQAAWFAKAANFDAPELAPAVRAPLLRQAFAGRGVDHTGKRFFEFWKVRGHSGLERALGCSIPKAGLNRMLISGAGQVPFSLVVSLVAFASETLGVQAVSATVSEVKAREVSLPRFELSARRSDLLSEALEAQARWLSLPREVAELLLRHDMAGASLLVGTLNLVSMIDRLPVQHQQSLLF